MPEYIYEAEATYILKQTKQTGMTFEEYLEYEGYSYEELKRLRRAISKVISN